MEGCGYDSRELMEMHRHLAEHGLKRRKYILLRDLIISSSTMSLTEAAKWSGLKTTTVRKYQPLLKDYDGIHLSSFHGTMWLVYATEAEAVICRKRLISLMAYVRLKPLLEEMREDLKRYYDRKFYQLWSEPVESMTEIKRRWRQVLAPIIYKKPPKKQRDDYQTYRQASRVINTVQDLVLREMGIPRGYAEKVIEGAAEVVPEAAECEPPKEDWWYTEDLKEDARWKGGVE